MLRGMGMGMGMGMGVSWAERLMTTCLLLCVTGLIGCSAVAYGAGASHGAARAGGRSPLESPLVVAGVQELDQGQQLLTAEEVMRASPEAVAARTESQTKYGRRNATQAAKLAREMFPAMINDPAGGAPKLPKGQQITGFLDATVAQVDLGRGQHGVVESVEPMAIQTSPGSWTPVNLNLSQTGGTFTPANPVVAVRIHKRLAEGVQALATGISLTPVNAQGAPLGGSEGTVDGASVLYANTQTDADTVMKPTTLGFEADTLLRSVQSPQQLFFRVGLPRGATLVSQAQNGSTAVRVVKEGKTIATIPVPDAQDAAGTAVPVTTSVSGNTVSLTLNHSRTSYQYPIEVDPEFNAVGENLTPGNWHFEQVPGGNYTADAGFGAVSMNHNGSFPSGDWAYWAMQTKGYTSIYAIRANPRLSPTFSTNGGPSQTYSYLRAWLAVINAGGTENELLLSGVQQPEDLLCVEPECSATNVNPHNVALFETTTVEPSTELEQNGHSNDVPFSAELYAATTYIDQQKGLHSTARQNLKVSELDGTVNVLNVPNAWMSPYSGAFEYTVEDEGLGVSGTTFEYYGSHGWEVLSSNNYLTGAGCIGVQCSATEHETFTYGNTRLPDGEDRIRVAAHSAIPGTSSSEYGEGEALVKVDSTPPHSLTLTGLQVNGVGFTLGEVETSVRAEATDGEGNIASSGIKSIALGVDGKEIGKAAGRCAPGPCSASGEWAINGAELGVGSHTLTVTATDIAGNIATKNYVLTVHAASPLAMGPGSVNPESGDFALDANDVDISGGLGALALTRHYDSRNVTEGAEGPLGPQWSLSLGSLASLEVLPDGSVLAIGPEGLTHFAVKTGGGFEAPAGDTNLALEYEPKTPAYLLRDPVQGTTTEFRLPQGAKRWMPTVSNGPVATDTMTDTYEAVEVEPGKKVVEPTFELAPHPSATCSPTHLEAGCRALTFTYANGSATGENYTPATGENSSEWGGYQGRLMEVYFKAWDPSKDEVTKTEVAQYAYDKQGRLRAEWDPRISPAPLKTVYGYDPEGHITAVTQAGEETWALTYGTIGGDTSTGRLLKMTRPAASAALWGGEAPKNTESPRLSGTANCWPPRFGPVASLA